MSAMRFLAFLAIGLALPSLAAAQRTEVGVHGAWRVFTEVTDAGLLCFAASAPVRASGTYEDGNRDPTYIAISTWPDASRYDEISIYAGYPYHAETDVTVLFDENNTRSRSHGKTFELATKGRRAWLRAEGTNLQMLDAMILGGEMRVVGVSTKRNSSNDLYSLTGVRDAVNQARAACGL